MATLETRDFLGILDQRNSSSFSSPLQFSLRVTESDCSNNAERVCQEDGNITDDAINDTSITYKRKRSADQTVLHGENMYGSQNKICPLDGLMSPLLRDSMTPFKIPIARKASLARFFQKRNERVQNLRLNGRNSSSDRSATFLEAKSERKSDAIPSDIIELELYSPSIKRQCLEDQ